MSRLLRSLVLEFQGPTHDQSDTTSASTKGNVAVTVREYFSSEVLKACISSFNEPYFVEQGLEKDLTSLIAAILKNFSPLTGTPGQVLLSLPGMTEGNVSSQLAQIQQAVNERQQRVLVSKLLEGVRGTSIHEIGKIAKPMRGRKSDIESRFMTAMAIDEDIGQQAPKRQAEGRDSPDLGGVADLLG